MPMDDEDHELIAHYRATRDAKTARRILTKFDRWCRIEARNAARGYGIDYQDALQAVRLGLMDAVEDYDPERGATLLTAASWKAWPHQSEARAHSRGTTRRKLEERRLLAKAKRTLGGQPTDEALLDHLGWTQGRLDAARSMDVSFDAPLVQDDDETSTRHDIVADKASLRPDAIVERAEHQSHLRAVLLGAIGTALSDRCAEVMLMYFEAGCETGAQADIARQLGLTRQRVAQIVAESMPKLRRALILNGVKAKHIEGLRPDEG